MQSVFDKLYENSLAKREFRNLISIITTEENIKLAYRNLKKNAGSKTPGTDGKTIAELAKMSEAELIQVVQRKFDWYQPQAVRRKEIPKGNASPRYSHDYGQVDSTMCPASDGANLRSKIL